MACFTPWPLAIVVVSFWRGVDGCDPALLREHGCLNKGLDIDWTVFLRLACEVCENGPGFPCRHSEELFAMAQIAAFPEKGLWLFPDFCLAGFFSAILYIAQFHDVTAMESVEKAFSGFQDATLHPFPFHVSSYQLYKSMMPAIGMFCNEEDRAINRYKYLPRATIADARCGVRYKDDQLVRRCRKRREWNSIGRNLPSRQHRAAKMQTLESSCPGWAPFGADLLLGNEQFKLTKYVERADHGQCASPQGMWRQPMSNEHKCVLVTIGELLGFQPGELMLDWGSGCGHTISWAKALFDVDGFGIDVVGGAVHWAKQFSAGSFCESDGRDLTFLPDEFFDIVFTFASIYHVQPKEDQCMVGIQLIQKLKIGGRAFFGWNREDVFAHEEWIDCFYSAPMAQGLNLTISGMEDAFLFPDDARAKEMSFLFQYPAFSMVIRRLPP
eukprot:TRINITY_DN14374_c0_g2_i1.p1 TRINITY_DN14374_c0_g2~~TRINITY_DN14374_c0_g2_i1.p1  ORF type:complete len:471 (+),score=53.19 TRINITY_DN14374_c0_g2_i1:91-1413(+)